MLPPTPLIHIFTNNWSNKNRSDDKNRPLNETEAKEIADALFPELANLSSNSISTIQTEFNFKQGKKESELGLIKINENLDAAINLTVIVEAKKNGELKLSIKANDDFRAFDIKFENDALKRTEAVKDLARLVFQKLEASVLYTSDSAAEVEDRMIFNSSDALHSLAGSPFSIIAKDNIRKQIKKQELANGAYCKDRENGSAEIQRYDQPFSGSNCNSTDESICSEDDYARLIDEMTRQ